MKKLLLISIAALFAGCSSAPQPNSPSPAANANTQIAAPANVDPEAEKAKEQVVASTKKLKDLKFWTAKTEIENLPMLSGEIRYAAPDRYYFKQGANEAIVVGDQTFTKENGKWVKSEVDMSGLKKIQENALTEEDVKKIQNVQTIGNETLNGRKTTIYAHSAISGGVESATKMWIDDDTKLVIKSVVENRAGKQVQRVITTYDFDTPVKIDAPKVQ